MVTRVAAGMLAVALAACGSANLDRASEEGTPRTDLGVRDVPVRGHPVVVFPAEGIDAEPVEGELIAVGPESIWVLDDGAHLRTFARTRVAKVAVRVHESRSGTLALWGGVGGAPLITHGFWVVFTAPVWAAASVSAAVTENREATGYVADDGLDALFQFARFPQGMPQSDPEPATPTETPPPTPAPPDAAPTPVPEPPPEDTTPPAAGSPETTPEPGERPPAPGSERGDGLSAPRPTGARPPG